MINQANLSGQLALDVKGTGELQRAARQNSPEALKAAAKQFEALFMNMVMKSMRDATPQDGMFDSQQSRMYTSMLDQQISQTLASRGVGLADVLIRQLSNNRAAQGVPAEDGAQPPASAASDAPQANWGEGDSPLPVKGLRSQNGDPSPTGVRSRTARPAHVQAFEDKLSAHAEEASRTTGIPAKFMLGQAALESGWGKREIVAADGARSHNLFGIKATSGWKGRVVEATTTEYVNGVPQRKVEKFRSYDSYADAFRDYARMLKRNPRYENVLANARDAVGFANGLQRAGYATDPHYASKLARIIQKNLSA